MRRPVKNRNIPKPDSRYNSVKVSKFINHIMERGKKDIARKIVYLAFEEIKTKEKIENPLEIFDMALKNASPVMEIRSRRVGGANYQVPREVRPERRNFLAMTWMIQAAQSKSGTPMYKRLSEELLLASKNEGSAVKKKEDTHKMAEANKAFAHFAW